VSSHGLFSAHFPWFFSSNKGIGFKPGMLACACNPSYSEGGDWKDTGLKPAQGKNTKVKNH
jgi:hypothetical protein